MWENDGGRQESKITIKTLYKQIVVNNYIKSAYITLEDYRNSDRPDSFVVRIETPDEKIYVCKKNNAMEMSLNPCGLIPNEHPESLCARASGLFAEKTTGDAGIVKILKSIYNDSSVSDNLANKVKECVNLITPKSITAKR